MAAQTPPTHSSHFPPHASVDSSLASPFVALFSFNLFWIPVRIASTKNAPGAMIKIEKGSYASGMT